MIFVAREPRNTRAIGPNGPDDPMVSTSPSCQCSSSSASRQLPAVANSVSTRSAGNPTATASSTAAVSASLSPRASLRCYVVLGSQPDLGRIHRCPANDERGQAKWHTGVAGQLRCGPDDAGGLAVARERAGDPRQDGPISNAVAARGQRDGDRRGMEQLVRGGTDDNLPESTVTRGTQNQDRRPGGLRGLGQCSGHRAVRHPVERRRDIGCAFLQVVTGFRLRLGGRRRGPVGELGVDPGHRRRRPRLGNHGCHVDVRGQGSGQLRTEIEGTDTSLAGREGDQHAHSASFPTDRSAE